MHLETEILKLIWSLHNPTLDYLMTIVTHLGDLGLIWIVICVIMAWKKQNRWIALEMALSLILSVLIGSLLLKPLIRRHRPSWIHDTDLLIRNPRDYSFPSGHTYSGFAVSTSLFFYRKTWGGLCYFLASLISFSRLYHFVHYPTDVLGGIVLGLICSVISHILVQRIIFPKVQQNMKRKRLK